LQLLKGLVSNSSKRTAEGPVFGSKGGRHMSESRDYRELMSRWDLHTDRQVNAAKGGITAVTILNSGSWIALLSQAEKIATIQPPIEAGGVYLAWGLGAFFGTLPWLFLYLNTLFLSVNDFDPEREKGGVGLWLTRFFGICSVITSLACFAWGVLELAAAM
jgi:hypothetical protein